MIELLNAFFDYVHDQMTVINSKGFRLPETFQFFIRGNLSLRFFGFNYNFFILYDKFEIFRMTNACQHIAQ